MNDTSISHGAAYNEDLVQQVRDGKLAIENTDKAKLADLIHHIFPDDTQIVHGTSKYYFKSEFRANSWADRTSKPNTHYCPVSDFLVVGEKAVDKRYFYFDGFIHEYNHGAVTTIPSGVKYQVQKPHNFTESQQVVLGKDYELTRKGTGYKLWDKTIAIPIDNSFHDNRKKAIEWWNNLTQAERDKYFFRYNKFTPAKDSHGLTGREIQNIWAVKTTPDSIDNKPVEVGERKFTKSDMENLLEYVQVRGYTADVVSEFINDLKK